MSNAIKQNLYLQVTVIYETDQASPLTKKEIQQILDHSQIQSNNNKSIIHRIFFLISLLCGLRGGDAYKLEMQSFSRRLDGGLNLSLYTEKNNQMGMFKRNKYGKSTARKIPMPADQENGRYKPINDILAKD
nr:8125_t:CDS:2 [Entrophospora candida]